jgi:hypothetical protein
MLQQRNVRVRIRKHKIAAIIMGSCIVILIIHHVWQEGIGSLITMVEHLK